MSNQYTSEINAQILISVLKQHDIKKVIASPGTTNIAFVASLQIDSYFEIYSAPDERSAAYIACGLAAESGEPVVLSCTGATASRNYYPALTEAFYRKLPILAVTSSRRNDRIGHNFDQVTDRTVLANDVAKLSVQMPVVFDEEGIWANEIAANKAALELKRNGGGPVHINLETMYNTDFNVSKIPNYRKIERYGFLSSFPEIHAENVAVIVGSHAVWNHKLVNEVESFCEKYNGIVICDHTSNYFGKYKVFPNLATMQRYYSSVVRNIDLLIHIGEISSSEYGIKPKRVWRVSEDGEIRDTFGSLEAVFEMSEEYFFGQYMSEKHENSLSFYKKCILEEEEFYNSIPDLPFSNAWTAMILSKEIKDDSVMHFGIRNSLRSWNLFKMNYDIPSFSNTGGFGIDGSLSTLLGASLCNKNNNYYCVLGDLAFFYDMNSLGNRHLGNNIRILLINNGTGMEMRFPTFYAEKIAAEKDNFISASGHYGNKSKSLVQNYASDLGFEYIKAESKEEFISHVDYFTSEKIYNKPIIFEVFIEEDDEKAAFNLLSEIKKDKIDTAKQKVIGLLGEERTKTIKKLLRK